MFLKKAILIAFCTMASVQLVQAQIIEAGLNQPGIAHGANISTSTYKFAYQNFQIPHYGLSWYTDNGGSPMAYLSGFAGIKMFTAGNVRMMVNLDGNVGLGTITPQEKFVVSRDGEEGLEVYLGKPTGTIGLQAYNRLTTSYVNMRFDAGNFSFMNGNVAIGTTDPKGYKLAVKGNIGAQEIRVENGSWPDYVFHKSYTLPSLRETEKFIQINGHLPEIPSAEEVKNNGVELGEMNARLLKKIEELTLHLIEKEKQLEAQELRIAAIEKTQLKNKPVKIVGKHKR